MHWVDPDLRQTGIAVIGALSASLRSDKILLDKISALCNTMRDALYNQDGKCLSCH